MYKEILLKGRFAYFEIPETENCKKYDTQLA